MRPPLSRRSALDGLPNRGHSRAPFAFPAPGIGGTARPSAGCRAQGPEMTPANLEGGHADRLSDMPPARQLDLENSHHVGHPPTVYPCTYARAVRGQGKRPWPPTLTDIGLGERSTPVRAPAPSRPEQTVRAQGGDHATANGGASRVLRVDGASERGYGHTATLIVIALAALAVIVLAVGSFVPSHSGSSARVQQRRSAVPGQAVPSRRAARTGAHRDLAEPRRVRSRRIARRPPLSAARSADGAGVCAVSCSSGRFVQAGGPAPAPSKRFAAQSAPVEEDEGATSSSMIAYDSAQ